MKKLYFLLVALFVGIFSAQAARVYFQNTGNWGTVAAYAWSPDNKGWPGIVLSSSTNTTTIDGTLYYFYDTPGAQTKIIFNNNNQGQQTKDLAVIDNAVYSYAQNSNNGGTTDPIGNIVNGHFVKAGEVVLTEGSLYFPVETYDKSKAYLYTWSPQVTGGWPGDQMTKVTLSNGEFWKWTTKDDRDITNVTIGGVQLNTGDNSAQVEYNKGIAVQPGYYINIITGEAAPVETYVSQGGVTLPDWYNGWINLVGGYNEWSTDAAGFQMTDATNPVASWSNQAIGQTGFKIKSWFNNTDAYYSAGGAVKVGEWFDCPVDANNAPEMTVAGASADATFDVEFNIDTKQLKLTLVSGTIDEGGQGGEDPGTTDYTKWTVNICGDWNDNTTYGDGSIYTTPTEEGIATFENLENLYQGFQIKTWDDKEDKWYNQAEGAIATDTWVVLGNAYGSVVNIEGATEKSIYTIEFDCKINSVRATLVSGGDTPTAPESIYIIGKPAGDNWAPNKGLEIKGTNGVYTTTLDFDATSYFGFATQLTEGDSQEDWMTLNEKYRIGAIENNSSTSDDHYLVSADQLKLNSALELGFKYPGTTSWGLPAGKYNVSLSWNNKQISITPTELRDEPVVATEFFLTGDFNTWAPADETYKFTQVDDSNVYTLSLESLPAGAEFKITNGSWDLSFGGEGEYGNNDPVNAVIGNNNMWKNSVNLIAGDWINIKFTFTYNENTDVASLLNIEATEVALPDDKVTYAVVGPIFQDNVQSMDMTLDGTTATLTATVQKQTFRIQKLVNGEVTATYGPTAAGDIINPGEYTGKEIDANGTPWVFSAVIIPEATADIEFSFNTESMVLTISKVETPASEELYIVGEGTINGTTLGWTPTSPLTVEGKDGVYTFSVKGGTKFQISTEKADWDEGYNKNGLCFDGRQNSEVQSSDINNPIKLYWGWAQDIVMPTNYAEYTVTVTLKGNVGGSESTMLIVPVGEVSYPETMYVIGNVNGEESWIPTNGYAMTKTADGVFKVTEMGLTRSAASEYAYFSFAESLATAEGDWASMGQRYGAAADNDYKLNGDANETAPIRAGETAFMIQIDPGATITMTLDFTTMQLTVDSTTMVDNVVVDGNDAPVYYNLQGVRVDNPAAGLYIVVRGNNVTKEVIR